MKLEEKYLNESRITERNIERAADRAFTEIMNSVSRNMSRMMKEAEMLYIKDPENNMSPLEVRILFAENVSQYCLDYFGGMNKAAKQDKKKLV